MIFLRVEKDRDGIHAFSGEAGHGIYCLPANEKKLLQYYKDKSPPDARVVRFRTEYDARVVDLTKREEKKKLIAFIKQHIEEQAKQFQFYIRPKINVSNYHRQPWAIQTYIEEFHSDCIAYIIGHSSPSGFRQDGKQCVIRALDKFWFCDL